MVGRPVADPEVIPLAGVAGVIEPVYRLASVIATEGAVADRLAAQLGRTDAPAATPDSVADALVETEARIGGALAALTGRSRRSAGPGGRPNSSWVWPGPGKTTRLGAVAAAFEASGCDVIGTATAGQAARAVGDGGRLERSSTLAALTGRLERRETRLGERSVVIFDEPGMTDDVDLARLATHVQLAGAKLIVVGDHRQLGAVGPGRAGRPGPSPPQGRP